VKGLVLHFISILTVLLLIQKADSVKGNQTHTCYKATTSLWHCLRVKRLFHYFVGTLADFFPFALDPAGSSEKNDEAR
jgi:hypothetical protein